MPKRPHIVVTRKLPDVIETRMMELFNAELNLEDKPFDQAALAAAMGRAEVLVPTVTDRIDKTVIAAAGPELKLIASVGTGVDHIDVDAAKAKGITVTNTPGVLTEDTADMAMALILDVMRRLSEGDRLVREGGWPGWSPTFMLGTRLGGKRLGIIGMGRIGQALARRARGFGMAVHYHNRKQLHADVEAELDATYWRSLDQMLAHMDVISINCPATPGTYHLLNARRLRLMKPQAVIVNTARGNVIDEAALVDRLATRDIGGAGLDVYEHEPVLHPRLKDFPNVVLAPHIGSATLESRIAMGEKAIINIRAFIDGHTPPDKVLITEF